MKRRHKHGAFKGVILGSAVALALLGGTAGAQPAGAEPQAASAAEAEARAHYKLADEHFKNEEWREALEEYRRSMAFKETRGAMASAAACLRALGQYDDALDQYEELRRKYPVLSPKMEEKVAPAMAELAGLVGTLVVTGDAPEKASIFVDDRRRGEVPLNPPLRLRVGSHTVRVEKEGFDALTATVEIKPGQENVARLEAKSKKGRLRVRERHNWALKVEIDGKERGVTPWDDRIEPGEHRVRLYGFMGVEALAACEAPEVKQGEKPVAAEAGAKMESAVGIARVALYQETDIVLDAEEQDASLRVESTPSSASLRIDGGAAVRTPWEGRLDLGEHTIEVSNDGFLTAMKSVRLERRKQREVQMQLEPKRDERGVRTARAAGIGVAYGLGAAGLGVFLVAGELALQKVNGLEERCPEKLCYRRDNADVAAASLLGTVSTIGLVVGGIGATAGTVVFFAVRPPASEGRAAEREAKAPRLGLRAGLGPGRFTITGEF